MGGYTADGKLIQRLRAAAVHADDWCNQEDVDAINEAIGVIEQGVVRPSLPWIEAVLGLPAK